MSSVRFLSAKAEAGTAIKEMIAELETAWKGQIKNLNKTVYENELVGHSRSDNVKEFLSRSFTNWLSRKGIIQELSSVYSPESNGKLESLNHALLDMSRTMLIGVNSESICKTWNDLCLT